MRRRRDSNAIIAGYLRDLAATQSFERSGWAFKRASRAVLDLDEQIETRVLPDGSLPRIRNVGTKSERVVREVVETGHSPTVERAIRQSGRRAEVEGLRALRKHFLSRAGAVDALQSRSDTGPTPSAYRGDLQMHSTWSDGTQELSDLAAAAIERGYAYVAITDHSYGLPVARGLSMSELTKQHREIDRLNRRYDGRFRLIKGIEANIRANGSVDMSACDLARLELIVAAPHSSLRTMSDQTARLIAAVTTPGIHILGHPRGRLYSTRAGVQANWTEVFRAAAQAGIAIEIDGDPWRQDIDYTLARRAVRAGCLFALDSDAHSSAEFRNAEMAIAHARLAGVPPERIINCWPLRRLLRWLGHRKPA